jgi:hypothetical protein
LNCATHPGEPIVATCDRCGGFVCRHELRELQGEPFCIECAARGDVDWLDAFRLELWGQRDEFAKLYGYLGTTANLLMAANAVAVGRTFSGPGIVLAMLLLANAGVDLCYFFGAAFARFAVVFFPVLHVGVSMALVPGRTADHVGVAFWPFAFALAAFTSTRNKLFFKIDPGEKALRRLWDQTRNNQPAQSAFTFGILGLLIPLFAPVALVCGLIGLHKVNPKAHPPIGKRGYAIAGLVLGCLSMVGWAVLIILIKFGR